MKVAKKGVTAGEMKFIVKISLPLEMLSVWSHRLDKHGGASIYAKAANARHLGADVKQMEMDQAGQTQGSTRHLWLF